MKSVIKEWRYWVGFILSIIANVLMMIGIAITSYMSKYVELKYIMAYTMALVLFSTISRLAFDIMDEARAKNRKNVSRETS